MRSVTLYRLLAVLLVLIAVALTVSHLGHVDTLDLTTGARIGGRQPVWPLASWPP